MRAIIVEEGGKEKILDIICNLDRFSQQYVSWIYQFAGFFSDLKIYSTESIYFLLRKSSETLEYSNSDLVRLVKVLKFHFNPEKTRTSLLTLSIPTKSEVIFSNNFYEPIIFLPTSYNSVTGKSNIDLPYLISGTEIGKSTAHLKLHSLALDLCDVGLNHWESLDVSFSEKRITINPIDLSKESRIEKFLDSREEVLTTISKVEFEDMKSW